ncbi:MerR family transcriptional regulator [Rhodobacter sp. KR11]|uniref:MerR family transcriptional regulator n=1 Tax=Rhodobacter sp. KR11 TaxID=2974588 RepID=UPI0022214E19|nr:MerR family transcriptional regulator [Rhodobacter sp. KR11]MCW1917782.1 MerR family transcriptional regulator [Rhodobacter sp. KR11]
MDKAPDAFRTISEVADYLETPSHVLRFWETRFPQVKPVKGAGGRRYYRPSDVALLAGIRRLLHTDGMTIRGVQKILRDQGVRHVAELGAELNGEPLPEPEALTDLLPPARAPAEVVALRPAAPPEPEPADLPPLAEPDDALPPDVGVLLPPLEEGFLDAAAIGSEAQDGDTQEGEGLQTEATKAALPDAADLLAAIRDDLPEEEPAPSFSPAITGFGGFGLDLDVPRDGEGGFIAFSGGAEPAAPAPPVGFVAPEARPKRPAPAQPSLFDLHTDGANEAPHDLLEPIDEAPHVFVDSDDPAHDLSAEDAFAEDRFAQDRFAQGDQGAKVLAFAASDSAEDGGEDEPFHQPDADPEPQPEEDPQDLPEESPQDVPEEAPQDGPEDLSFADPLALSDPPPQVPALAGLTPRLRRLSQMDPDPLFALADLQARLGLLHAQMVEAAARHRRAPGE